MRDTVVDACCIVVAETYIGIFAMKLKLKQSKLGERQCTEWKRRFYEDGGKQ